MASARITPLALVALALVAVALAAVGSACSPAPGDRSAGDAKPGESGPGESGPAPGASVGRAAPFVGPERCAPCHEKKALAFEASAHRNTSALPAPGTILGSFEPPDNRLITGGGRAFFTMERRGGAFFQTAYTARDDVETTRRIDVVFGSGKLGQTYAYRSGDDLFQLPVSYLRSERAWMNSPGARYADGTADFTRPIVPACLECHSTWIEHAPGTLNTYRLDTFLPGVTCERCHGPGGEHVAYHESHPDATEPHAIVHPGDLTRERALDLCGQCHGGVGELLRPAFSYRPGEPLGEHVTAPPPPEPGAEGVHSANQLPRLVLSRCFQESATLTCASCHDPHVVERGQTREFSARCLVCHEISQCGGDHAALGDPSENCIDCHMPLIDSATTTIRRGTEVLRPPIRDHRIAVPGR